MSRLELSVRLTKYVEGVPGC